MNKIIGTTIERIPFQDIYKVADLTYLNGPLLSLFRDGAEQSYIYYWCDADTICNRWLVFQISDEQLDGYIKEISTLYELITQPLGNQLFVVDIDGQGKHLSVVETEPNALPDSYKPKTGTYYEPSSTKFYDEEIAAEFLSILVDEINLLRQPSLRYSNYSAHDGNGIASKTQNDDYKTGHRQELAIEPA